VQLGAAAIDQGQVETVLVHTRPFAHLRFSVGYRGRVARTTGVARADRTGTAAFRFPVAVGPSGNGPPLAGVLSVRVSEAGLAGDATARFTVYPALHLAVRARLIHPDGDTVLVVQVTVARTGMVQVTARVPGQPARQLSARGTAMGGHPLTLRLAPGRLHGHTVIGVAVRVITREGVVEGRTLAVAA
jgi:hypothetical protein